MIKLWIKVGKQDYTTISYKRWQYVVTTQIVSETHTNWQWFIENLDSMQVKYKTLQGNSSQTRKAIYVNKNSNVHILSTYQQHYKTDLENNKEWQLWKSSESSNQLW